MAIRVWIIQYTIVDNGQYCFSGVNLLVHVYSLSCSVLVMPQWSVAEWRARIGGSWLAIGRLIKSKLSSSSGGAGCMRRVLTMNHVVTMMSLTLVLIGVNLLLRALLVNRGDLRPITGWYKTLQESLHS